MAGGYIAKLCNPYGEKKLYNVMVCIDKGWGEPGCRYYNGQFEYDWGDVVSIDPYSCWWSPTFYPNDVLTVVTDEGWLGYVRDYVHAYIYDENGNVLVTCPSVYIDKPCYLRLIGAIQTYTSLNVQQL